MVQIQLICNILVWEKGLEFTEERRKGHRFEPYMNYLAAPQPGPKESKYREEDHPPVDFLSAFNNHA